MRRSFARLIPSTTPSALAALVRRTPPAATVVLAPCLRAHMSSHTVVPPAADAPAVESLGKLSLEEATASAKDVLKPANAVDKKVIVKKEKAPKEKKDKKKKEGGDASGNKLEVRYVVQTGRAFRVGQRGELPPQWQHESLVVTLRFSLKLYWRSVLGFSDRSSPIVLLSSILRR